MLFVVGWVNCSAAHFHLTLNQRRKIMLLTRFSRFGSVWVSRGKQWGTILFFGGRKQSLAFCQFVKWTIQPARENGPLLQYLQFIPNDSINVCTTINHCSGRHVVQLHDATWWGMNFTRGPRKTLKNNGSTSDGGPHKWKLILAATSSISSEASVVLERKIAHLLRWFPP